MQRTFLAFTLAVAAMAPACAAAWPNGPFNYTVPFVKGGGSASIAELQAGFIPGTKLVYNSANSGATAWANMKNDPTDGSVVTLINFPHTMLQPVYPGFNANYTFDDIKVAYIHSYTPLALIVPATSDIKTWADFVKACRTANSTMIISGAAKGTVFDLATTRLKRLARIDVAYESAGDGANAAIAALLQGKYRAAWTTTPAVFNRPDLRTLAIAAEFEFPQIDAPTFKLLGINYVDGIYRALGLPAGTPENVMMDVSNYMNTLVRNLTYISKVLESGAVQVFMPYGSVTMKAFIASQLESVNRDLFPPDAISRESLYGMLTLGALGLLMTAGAALFALVYRNTPIIKGSSYFFNNVILIGIAIAYLSVIVNSLQMPLSGVTQASLTKVCRAMPWVLGLGFDITFAAIIVKSYRLYRLFLFSASSVIQFKATNWAIMQWVFGICSLNAIVYAVWTIQDPMTATMNSLDGDRTFYYTCEGDHTSAYLATVLTIKYLMLSACAYFCFKLRELSAALNESKAIAAATFSTAFILTICLGVYSMVNSFQGRFIIYTAGIFLGTTGCLAALFLPKLMVTVFAPQTNTREHFRRLIRGTDRSHMSSSDEGSQAKSGGRKNSQEVSGLKPLSQGRKPSLGMGIGTLQSINSMGSMASNGNLSPRLGAAASVIGGIPVSSTHAAPTAAPIYVTDGKQLAREHRDRIAGLVRVINNTAASGRITDFQEHIAQLQAFASRFKILHPAKSRAMSIGAILSGNGNEKAEKEKELATSPKANPNSVLKSDVYAINEDV